MGPLVSVPGRSGRQPSHTMSRAIVTTGGRPSHDQLSFTQHDSEDTFSSSEEDEEHAMHGVGGRQDAMLVEVAKVGEFFSSLFILCFMVLIYLWGAVELCRKHIWLEALFTVALPVFAINMGWQAHTQPFQRKLIYLDTLFNVFAILAKIAIVSNLPVLNTTVNYASIIFLLLQFGWYVAFCIKEGLKDERTWRDAKDGMHWFTAVMASTMFLSLVVERAEAGHFFYGAANTLGPEGELLFWGQDAGVMIKINYLCWQIYVLFCDDFKQKVSTEGVEGYMMVPVAQFCSVVLAWWSGEFWHARMITGVHLVLMDGIHHSHNASYRSSSHYKSHGEFCVMPAHWFKEWESLTQSEKYWALRGKAPVEEVDEYAESRGRRSKPCCTQTLVPCLRWFLLIVTLLVPATAVACGSTEFFCGTYVGVHHLWT